MAWRYATKAEIAAAAKASTHKKKKAAGGWSMVSSSKGVAPKTYKVGNTPVTPGGYQGMSDAEILRQAGLSADSSLSVRQAAIERQRRAAQAAAERDRAAIAGLGDAQMKMLAPIPAQITGIRDQAGAAIAGYGKGYSDQIKGTIEQGQQNTAQDIAAQGQAPAPTVDAAAAADANYALSGEIPATESTSIGAASGMAAAGMPAVVARAAQEDIMQRMAEAAAEDATYRAQLIDLAAERPGLVADAMDRLYAIEEKKYGRYEAEQRMKLDQEQLALQQRAQTANEKALGIKTAQANQRLDISSRSLQLREAKYATDLQKAEAAGHKIDAAASKVVGYVVDVQGNPILGANGQRIKVVQNTKDKATQTAAARQKATQEALKMRGTPVLNTLRGGGKYVGRKGAKGLLPSGTTNDINRAEFTGGSNMNFGQAQNYIMSTYGLNRAQARAVLVAAGWRPGG